MSNLKPCPFCNGEARISTEWDTDGFGNFHSVKCGKCGAESKQHFASSGNDCPQHYAEVREDWNQRASGWTSVKETPINGHSNWKCGEKSLGWNGYAFEIEWDGDFWCSLGGDEPTHWMLLPNNPE